ncbi:VOC family protein [Nocardia vermiculata]|uniref:VOC family protein n=1 Tax=Nocardia vermiculata TaxID=257274 RepID=A0A846Y0R9_9NOCA|nr:VOC family protein [Nocardia vermiculata]NKY51504.1 VOC family protein [Nocardia vermiculata]
MQSIVTNLWFDDNAEEAAQYYIEALGDGRIIDRWTNGPGQPGKEGTTMAVEFELRGQRFVGINGGPVFHFSEAISLEVRCRDQADIDRVWDALVAGGSEQPCGWLKDKFGLSWQVTSDDWTDYLQGDPAAVARFMDKMLSTHGKFDLAELRAAYAGTA